MSNRPLHGGAAWDLVRDQIQDLKTIVPADVADAWYPPAPEVVDGLHAALAYIQWAPATWADGLSNYLPAHYGLPPESILVDAGSSPLIDRIMASVIEPNKEVVLVSPTYAEYLAVAER